MKKLKEPIILITLILLLFVLNYSFLDEKLEGFLVNQDSVLIERIIDGDTVEIENKTSIRLLGINSPERGEAYYSEAKEFLEVEILNKPVELEYIGERQDKYGRTLAYIYFNGENININLVKNGFANHYFYSGKDIHSDDLLNAWNSCIENNVNLCEKSTDVCKPCISISQNKIVNECDFDCNITSWEIKGEGRKKFIFSNETLKQGKEIPFELEFIDTGDTLFLRDEEGKLVSWERE
jgi:micrococcal nuclease